MSAIARATLAAGALVALAGAGTVGSRRAAEDSSSVAALNRAFALVAEDADRYLKEVALAGRIDFDDATGRIRGVAFDPFARARWDVPSLAYAAIYAVNRGTGARRALARTGERPGASANAARKTGHVLAEGAEVEVQVWVVD